MSTVAHVRQLEGPPLSVARAAFSVALLVTLLSALGAVPEWVDRALSSAALAAKSGDGVPYQAISIAVIGLGLSSTAVQLATAWLVYRARSRDALGLVVAYNSVVIGFTVVGPWIFAPASGLDQALTRIVTSMAFVTLMWATLVFPDGRFVPRGSMWILIIFGVWQFGRAVRPELGADALGGPWPLVFVAFYVVAILTQVYRYGWVARAGQRGQLRWWLFGSNVFIFAYASYTIARYVVPSLTAAGPLFWFAGIGPATFPFAVASAVSIYAASIVFAGCLAISILRYAWFDIDVVISRTLAYTASTSLLVAAFGGIAILLSRVVGVGTGPGAELTSTLALAAVLGVTFVPLRRWLEAMSDRLVAPRADLTLLFVDIVGSTETLARLGDAGWADALTLFRATVRRELGRHDGQEIDTTGDGFFVTFASPAPAVACACALQTEIAAIGLSVRTGIHRGTCELRGRAPIGLNVHLASRLMSIGGPGDILVSAAVAEAIADGPHRLRAVGPRVLRGVPGEHEVLAIECASTSDPGPIVG